MAAPHRSAVADRWWLVEALVLVVALVPRLGFVLYGAGLRGTFGYDPSVYYAAADALLHGRLPYRDFTLLHPPGIVLALTPFAKLGMLTTDHTGFAVATVAWILLGCVNAVLVMRVVRVAGLDGRAALVGGLFYAVWLGAVGAEYLVRLETLGNTFLLLGLLWLMRCRDDDRRRAALWCGAALGAATAVKIWWVVPLVLVLGYFGVPRRRARLPFVAAGAAAVLVVVDGPFFALAPSQMWAMTVSDQLNRNAIAGGLTRFAGVSAVRQWAPHLPHPVLWVLGSLAVVVFGAVCASAWRVAAVRLVVVLAVAQVLVLGLSPSWFPFYDDYAAPAAAVCVGVALRRRNGETVAVRRAVAGVAALVATAAAVGCIVGPVQTVLPYPAARFAAAVGRIRCVQADSPMPLIEMDVLSRDLAHGCQNWVDVTGRTYGPDRAAGRVPRPQNARWQCDLTRYLLSGGAVTLFRTHDTGPGRALRARLARLPVLARGDGQVLRAVPPGAGRVPARCGGG